MFLVELFVALKLWIPWPLSFLSFFLFLSTSFSFFLTLSIFLPFFLSLSLFLSFFPSFLFLFLEVKDRRPRYIIFQWGSKVGLTDASGGGRLFRTSSLPYLSFCLTLSLYFSFPFSPSLSTLLPISMFSSLNPKAGAPDILYFNGAADRLFRRCNWWKRAREGRFN